MSNGTRKKKVDFKKLLITEEESKISFRKKSTKSSNTLQNISNKKEKSQKNSQKQRENKEKLPEKNIPKKIKIKDLKGKEQIKLIHRIYNISYSRYININTKHFF